jgi:colicin import membrane protein
VTVRSPLDTLKELRQQVHDAEQARLATQATLESCAEAEKERARERLAAAEAEAALARRQEDERLTALGITASEGQLRAHWEDAERRHRARLGQEHARAVENHRAAIARHDQARVALSQADAELRVVQERLDQRARLRQRGEELAQQEIVDESSLRRFQERNGA